MFRLGIWTSRNRNRNSFQVGIVLRPSSVVPPCVVPLSGLSPCEVASCVINLRAVPPCAVPPCVARPLVVLNYMLDILDIIYSILKALPWLTWIEG